MTQIHIDACVSDVTKIEQQKISALPLGDVAARLIADSNFVLRLLTTLLHWQFVQRFLLWYRSVVCTELL